MACADCNERGCGANCTCGCHGCDCCPACLGSPVGDDHGVTPSCCGSYPEYNCPGECRDRGAPGHYKVKPAGDPHPTLSFPDRICRQTCCRPEVR